MGSSDSLSRIFIGHRKLISLQQQEIENLKRDLRKLERTTTRLLSNGNESAIGSDREIAAIRREIEALRKASIASDTLQTLETQVAQLRESSEQQSRRQRREIEALRNDFRNLEQLQGELHAHPLRAANDPHHELRELRKSIRNLETQKASATELSSLASTVERLKKASGAPASSMHRYKRTWTWLVIFNLIVIVTGAVGLDRSWRWLQEIAPGLPSIHFGVLAIVLLSGILALNLTTTSAWRLLSWKDKHRLPFIKQISGARMMSLGAIFVSALAYLARVSL